MKTVRFFLAILAVTLLAACSDSKDYSGDFGEIKVPDTRQLDQTAGPGDTQTARGVTFSTEGAWSSSITRTRAEAPEWITISPDHGDAAGSYTLKIGLQPNTTAETREARIVITCGTSKIEITVTQQGTDTPSETPAETLIERIEHYYEDTTPEGAREWDETYAFEYDAQHRIAKIEQHRSADLSNEPDALLTFAYPDANTIKIVSSGDEHTLTRTYTVTLDKAGRAVAARRDDSTDRWTFAYDAEGYCIECRQYEIANELFYPLSTFTWRDGNLVALDTFEDMERNNRVESYSFTYTYTAQKNDTSLSIDLNALLFDVNPGYMPVYGTDLAQVLSAIGRMGRRSANLTATNMMPDEFSASFDPENEIYIHSKIVDTSIEWTRQNSGRPEAVVCSEKIETYKTQSGKTEIMKSYTQKNSYTIFYTE